MIRRGGESMETPSGADSKRSYSWWWDSHISPKTSKWLLENLSDMDEKIQQMIKLIEEDADSFAKRAEMYYKKRPELMKLVEGFYRAYRALAERYDNATVVIHQAHRTMAEAFPNHISIVHPDDSSPANFRTPEKSSHMCTSFDLNAMEPEDAFGLPSFHAGLGEKSQVSSKGSNLIMTREKWLKHLNELFNSGAPKNLSKFEDGTVRKGLNFHDLDPEEESIQNNGSHDLKKNQAYVESGRVDRAETEISSLKNALASLEAEKELGLLQYNNSLQRLSKLESDVSITQEDSRSLNERAGKAETEVLTLKESLAKLETERETSLLRYQQCLDKLSTLQDSILCVQKNFENTERASKAETEVERLKWEVSRVESQREAALVQYKESSDIILNLEERVAHAEEDARRYKVQADEAQSEVLTIREALAQLVEETKAAGLRHHLCTEKIVCLEHQISNAQEELERLQDEKANGVAKLKGAEERCLHLQRSNQFLQSEMDSIVQKIGSQSVELIEKQKELGRLWVSMQEERLRYVENETSFRTLQELHSKSQEEIRSMAEDSQIQVQNLKEMESRNQILEDEVQKIEEEKRSLKDLTLSSELSINCLRDEMSNMTTNLEKLEASLEFQLNQKNVLEREILCLKEELHHLKEKNFVMLKQIESVGFAPENFGSSVKELYDENSKMIEQIEVERREKSALLEKLKVMEEHYERNSLLDNNTISDLHIELESQQTKVKALEECCQLLSGEKSTLVTERTILSSQLQMATDNIERQSEKNTLLESSLSDANFERKRLAENLEKLHCLNNDLEERVRLLERNLEDVQLNNLHLRKSLERSENELLEAEQILIMMQNEKSELHKRVEELTIMCEEAKAVVEEKENVIVKLSGDSKHLVKEIASLRELKFTLKVELGKMQEDVKQHKHREKSLRCELVKKRMEVEICETRADELFGELQISSVHEILFKGKLLELNEAYANLKNRSNYRDVKTDTPSERINPSGELGVHLSKYTSAVTSLNDSVTYLENHTLLCRKTHKYEKQEVKDTDSVSHQSSECYQKRYHDLIATLHNGSFELKDLHRRIQAVEMAVIEKVKLETLEDFNSTGKQEMVMRRVEEAACGSIFVRENDQTRPTTPRREIELGNEMQRPKTKVFEVSGEILTKDIILDQMAKCSNGVVKREENLDSYNQMLELWEATDEDGSIDLMVCKSQNMATSSTNYSRFEVVKEQNKRRSTDSLVEKEVGVDILETSSRLSVPLHKRKERKILERLDSDMQKLTNLQITVQDLTRIVLTKQSRRNNNAGEYDTMKQQLEEVEAAVMKLFNANCKLMKNVQDGTLSSDGGSTIVSEESGNVRKRIISAQARRGSKKIGQLQLEVQRLQFLLLKQNEEKESKSKTKIIERPKVRLQDYLYGSIRSKNKHKKPTFCGCMHATMSPSPTLGEWSYSTSLVGNQHRLHK